MTEREILNYIYENAYANAEEIRKVSYKVSDNEQRKKLNEKLNDRRAFANVAKEELEELEYEVSEELTGLVNDDFSVERLFDNTDRRLREIGRQYGEYRKGDYRKDVASIVEAAVDFLGNSLDDYGKMI